MLELIRRNPWPYAIIGWFLIFGSGMAAWVVVALRNDPELVRADYYEQEIAYQKQIDRLNRTAAAGGDVSVAYEAALKQIVVRLPVAQRAGQPAGAIHFYRPSNAKLDFELPLALDADGAQRVPSAKLQGGLWKVRVQWTAGGEEFLHDQSLVL
jgi:nitrogen fixation protein FixH